MILLLLLVNVEPQPAIDSLRALINARPQLNVILELNSLYRITGEFDSSIALLKNYEKKALTDEKPLLFYTLADNYFFVGKILNARDSYVQTVGRFSKSEIANNALEQLYLIEMGRKDTVLLKRLTRFICYFETSQLRMAEDSLKSVFNTKLGDYAYYYSALLYKEKNELSLALSALNELNIKFPDNKIHRATLLTAEIYLDLKNKKEAQKILEELIVKAPETIYAIRARKLLAESLAK